MRNSFLQAIFGKSMISAVESIISNSKDYDAFELCARNGFFTLLEKHFLGKTPSWVRV